MNPKLGAKLSKEDESALLNRELDYGNTCMSCRWWGRGNLAFNENIDGYQVKSCSHPMVRSDSKRTGAKSELMVFDGVLVCDEGGHTGLLMTAARFGCVHHVVQH